MDDFFSHFGAPTTPPKHPMEAYLGQDHAKFGQNVNQRPALAEKAYLAKACVFFYYVFELLAWALERIGRLKDAL